VAKAATQEEENEMPENLDNAQGGGGGEQQTYTVKSGDTLSKISQHFYGDAGKYMDIYYANRDKIEDPDNIQAGTELTIPPAS
jgi:nucleoid-associated protein YgaU